MSTPIQRLIENHYELQSFLMQQGEISQSVEVTTHYKKILLLSATSFFESEISEAIRVFVEQNVKDQRIAEVVKNKVIKRQYHTYFDWKQSKNANNFFGLFGDEYKNNMSSKVKGNEELSNQLEAFLILGQERNKMVHENFLEYQLDKTFEEIIKLYENANKFVDFIKSSFQK